jgi:hypothetical protein
MINVEYLIFQYGATVGLICGVILVLFFIGLSTIIDAVTSGLSYLKERRLAYEDTLTDAQFRAYANRFRQRKEAKK